MSKQRRKPIDLTKLMDTPLDFDASQLSEGAFGPPGYLALVPDFGPTVARDAWILAGILTGRHQNYQGLSGEWSGIGAYVVAQGPSDGVRLWRCAVATRPDGAVMAKAVARASEAMTHPRGGEA